MKHCFVWSLTFVILSVGSIGRARGESDWPQWRGPDRNGISKETGLLKSWPKEGPKQIWTISTLGDGYGSVSIQGKQMFVQGTQGKESALICLNRADGKTLWSVSLGPELDQDQGPGPRGTPTIEKDLIYVMDEGGNLACLKSKDGSVVWKKNILQDFKGANPNWHISESPLVDGDHLIVTPGGPDATIVALDKKTGATVWTSKGLSEGAGYSSCIPVTVGKVRAYTTITASGAVGVRASDGKPLWDYKPVANNTANIATPVFADDKVFYTTAYGTGCALVGLKTGSDEIHAQEIYFNKDMQNHHGGVVLIGGYLYGFSGDILTCMEFATGKVAWKNRSVGKGSLTYADGHLYLLSEANVAGLAEASPQAYKESGRFTIPDQGRHSWAHPVVCGGKLYLRNQGWLGCYDVKGR